MTRTIHVARLSSFPTSNDGMKWWIYEGQRTSPVCHTFSAWQASLAQRARDLNKPVTIGTRQTKWGDELVSIEFAPETSAEGAA